MKAKELRELSIDELNEKSYSFKKELYELANQASLGMVDKHTNIRRLKKDIARINTILRERRDEER